MSSQGRSVLAASVAAALGGVSGAAHAAVYPATLTQVLTYSNNGTAGSAGNLTSSTATWVYDDVAQLLFQTGGLYNMRLTTAPTSTLYRTSITGLVIGTGGPAGATSYVCTEGNFGTGVGASLCGNYNFGGNFENGSTTSWGPGTAVSRTIGDDDVITGDQRSLATLDGMNTISWVGTALVLANKSCTGSCTTYPAGAFNDGQQWTLIPGFDPIPPDGIPDPFAFTDQSGVALASTITSAPVTVTGITGSTTVSVTGGAYSINGGPFVTTAGSVTYGNTLRVRHTSSGAPATAVDTVLNVGGVTDTFTSTTVQYAFDDAAVTPINQAVPIDVLQNDAGLAAIVSVGVWTNPGHGTASVTGSPGAPAGIRITYTPDPGYYGPDSFEYWVETGAVVDYGVVNITVTNADADGDGVVDLVDNCTQAANPGQCDSDGDGYGNRCDGDLTNNGVTNAQDNVAFRNRLGGVSAGPAWNAADLNCNGVINAQDTVLFRQLLGFPPGPSGLHP